MFALLWQWPWGFKGIALSKICILNKALFNQEGQVEIKSPFLKVCLDQGRRQHLK